ncbi:hypothetical protein DRN74_02635 [Candidatus Micrarchaeota archaeon]|nr:MAG: hypothetical protein DRN74_02635 [Candidatus Micrarchaeota archaeon]
MGRKSRVEAKKRAIKEEYKKIIDEINNINFRTQQLSEKERALKQKYNSERDVRKRGDIEREIEDIQRRIAELGKRLYPLLEKVPEIKRRW